MLLLLILFYARAPFPLHTHSLGRF